MENRWGNISRKFELMSLMPFPKNEAQRLLALRYYGILDTPGEKDFDEIVELASQICQTPISTITLIDANRQWFKAKKGLVNSETSRDIAFCSHTILYDDIMMVPDATNDSRFSGNPLVTGSPDIRFYAGMPLITEDGYKLGTLCVIDNKPKELTESQQFSLRILTKQVMKLIELRVRIRELSKLNEANKKLLSVIGHDLRSPLNSLTGLISLVEGGGMSQPEFLAITAQIKDSIASADTLLANLIHWATAQFEGKGQQFITLNLNEIIKAETDPIQSLVRRKGNDLMNQVDPTVQIRADPDMIRFIIRNLILNANKFTAKGKISVSSVLTDGHVLISVEDTGVGISADRLVDLFEWSKRLSTRGTNGEKGSGFGLQVCKDFVEKLGGTIHAESELGKGTKFFLSLPF